MRSVILEIIFIFITLLALTGCGKLFDLGSRTDPKAVAAEEPSALPRMIPLASQSSKNESVTVPPPAGPLPTQGGSSAGKSPAATPKASAPHGTAADGSALSFAVATHAGGTSAGDGNSHGLLSFDKVETDHTSAYNASLGLFVAPSAGIYQLHSVACFSANAFVSGAWCKLMLYKNNQEVSNGHAVAYSGACHVNAARTIELKAGDRISVGYAIVNHGWIGPTFTYGINTTCGAHFSVTQIR